MTNWQEYKPHRELRANLGDMTQTTLTFTGQHKDRTGLLFSNARSYDPALGQFISPDLNDGGVEKELTGTFNAVVFEYRSAMREGRMMNYGAFVGAPGAEHVYRVYPDPRKDADAVGLVAKVAEAKVIGSRMPSPPT